MRLSLSALLPPLLALSVHAADKAQEDLARRLQSLAGELMEGPRGPGAVQEPLPETYHVVELRRFGARGRELLTEFHEVERLFEQLPERYAEGADADSLARDRGVALARFNATQDEYHALQENWSKVLMDFKVTQGAKLLGQVFSGGEHRGSAEMAFAAESDTLRGDLANAAGEMILARTAEDTAWQEFYRRHQERERTRVLLLAGGGLLLLGVIAGALVAFVARRRRAAAVAPASPALPASVALPGAQLPGPGAVVAEGYRVVAALRSGPLGPAFQAVELESRARVYLKTIRPELHADELDLQAFLAQARASAALRHPNIIEVESVFLEGDRVHIAAEWFAGRTLAELLAEGGALPPERARALLEQAAAALDCAHAANLLHGDLRPGKILISAEGGVKVADFGLGIEARKSAAKLAWHEPLGSPAYLAPEVELGSNLPASDIFALGAVYYEALTARAPFSGPNFLAQKRERRWTPPSALARGLPDGIDALIAKAFAEDPARRFRTASELAQAVAVPGTKS